jgi:hypothetical protein
LLLLFFFVAAGLETKTLHSGECVMSKLPTLCSELMKLVVFWSLPYMLLLKVSDATCG